MRFSAAGEFFFKVEVAVVVVVCVTPSVLGVFEFRKRDNVKRDSAAGEKFFKVEVTKNVTKRVEAFSQKFKQLRARRSENVSKRVEAWRNVSRRTT
jgi:benzoyl-CoA reductase/2-hydroxyglutaryl-CoA dehydratase subunit BcrC/BadD/HgdB